MLLLAPQAFTSGRDSSLERKLSARLREVGFTGRVESTLDARLGRPVDPRLANIGRLLWFDTITGLNNDNTCAGCHSPTNGFGDTQSIAIGIDNNGIVGPDRAGPRNHAARADGDQHGVLPDADVELALQRALGRSVRQQRGFLFPRPEGSRSPYQPHLLVAQAFIPPTERTEVAGLRLPGRQRRHPRRGAATRSTPYPNYRELFGRVFPEVPPGRADHLRHVRAQRSPSSSSRYLRRTRRSTASRAASATR